MSIYFGIKMADGVTTVRRRCQHCLKGANLLKTMLVIVCVVTVGQQISVSIRKLIDIPVTTYTHFDFNKTITYPSVTFCREPPYKIEKLLKYGLKSYPRVPRAWSTFNFSNTPLQQLWDEITYDAKEVFVQYTLNGLPENLNMSSTLGLITGRCFTLSPNVKVNRASQASGYSVILQHADRDIAISTSTYPPGYHVHVHYMREPYTEVEVYNGGLVDYLYVNSGETVDVKLTVDQYVKISDEDDPCTDALSYSTNNCTTRYVWDTVTSLAGCSAPWMTSHLPHCSNYSAMDKLISAYVYVSNNHVYTGCPRICRSYLYNAFVTARQSFFQWDSSENQWFVTLARDIPSFTQVEKGHATAVSDRYGLRITVPNLELTRKDETVSMVYIHFNSMMVSVYEERYNYDWNLFLSDLGGSVGFLLGLSVIGLMNLLTNVWYRIKPVAATEAGMDAPSTSPAVTTDLAAIDYKRFSCYNILNY